jgi:hypothetical protein
MKFLRVYFAAVVAALSLPAGVRGLAQSGDAGPQAAAQATGPENTAITDRYLTAVQSELVGKIDTKSAVVGQEVDARTRLAATLADGTALPRGTKLVGHVTRVQAQDNDHPYATLAIAFDHAELKGGQAVALRSVIRMVAPPAAQPPATDLFAAATGPAGSIAPMSGTGSTGSRGGGSLGATLPGPRTSSVGRTAGSALGDAAGGADSAGQTMGGAVAKSGETVSTAPRPTGLPGVMLSAPGGANVSGTLMAQGRNISLDSGTQITMGVIAR